MILWRDLELGEEIRPGDRCCGKDHKWFVIEECHLQYSRLMDESTLPTQRKMILRIQPGGQLVDVSDA